MTQQHRGNVTRHALRASTLPMLVATLAIGSACGGGYVVERTPPPAPTVAEPALKDDLDRFTGEVVAGVAAFRLVSDPIGISAYRAIISLSRVDWSISQEPGEPEVKEATATIQIRRHGKTETRRIDEGMSRDLLGLKVTVVAADEDYIEERAGWRPWVQVLVSSP